MTEAEKYREADRRANANRAAFMANIATFKARVAPARLKADALGKARMVATDSKDRAVETIRAHPVALSAGVAAIGAWLLRKPLLRLARRIPLSRKARPVVTSRYLAGLGLNRFGLNRFGLNRFGLNRLDLARLGLTRHELSRLGLTRLKIAAGLLHHYLPKALRRTKT